MRTHVKKWRAEIPLEHLQSKIPINRLSAPRDFIERKEDDVQMPPSSLLQPSTKQVTREEMRVHIKLEALQYHKEIVALQPRFGTAVDAEMWNMKKLAKQARMLNIWFTQRGNLSSQK